MSKRERISIGPYTVEVLRNGRYILRHEDGRQWNYAAWRELLNDIGYTEAPHGGFMQVTPEGR